MIGVVARPRRSRLLRYGLKESFSKLIKLDLLVNSFILSCEKFSSDASTSFLFWDRE